MYCRNCGAKLRDDSKFCSVCGERIEAPKANSIGDTQEIMISKSDFMKQKYEYEDEYEDDNYEEVKSRDYKLQNNKSNDFTNKYMKTGALIVGAIVLGVVISLFIVKFSSNSAKTSNGTESVEAQKQTNKDTESKKETKQDATSKEENAATSSKNSKSEDKKEVENQDKNINTNNNINNNNNPNNIPLNGQINYVSDSLKGGNVKFAYPSFFNISDRTDNYIDLQTNNSDALITVSINNNLSSNSRSAKDKYNSTIDKLKLENAEIGYSNLSKRESVVTWKKDGMSYYQCDRYNANGTRSDSFIVSYPNAQEHYYYDIIQYIYDNFNTSADLK